jgi:ABC-type multidrug transport system fused ATPase/permease subunit
VVFTTLVGVVFVTSTRQRALADRARLLRHRAAARLALSSVLSAADQARAEDDRGRDHGARRVDHRVAAQRRAGEEPRASGPRRSARLNATTEKILELELKKVRYLRSLSFVQGTCVNALRTGILFLMLYLIFAQQITVGQFFALWIYSFFIFGPLQELGNVINVYREAEVSLAGFQAILAMPREPRPADPVEVGG